MWWECRIAVVVLTLHWACPAVWGESVAERLERAVYTEMTVGDVDGAIRIYESIVADEGANRRYVARALYRLGTCYLKKGDPRAARASFERLITDFPDQEELVARARASMPAPPFPEFDGCRVVETVSLRLSAPPSEREAAGSKADARSPVTLYEYSRLRIAWESDPALADGTRSYGVRISAADETVATAVVRDRTHAMYGELTGAAQALTPGDYVVTVRAYGTDKETVDDQDVIAEATQRLNVAPLPYTQILIADIQADGLIAFRNIMQWTNESGRTLRTWGFVNSDFVRVTEMTDDAGEPIAFTTRREGSMFRYRLRLNQPVEPGAALIHASEGTMVGGIKPVGEDEFEFRMNHHPATGTQVRRIETYLLPKGAEVTATEPADMARRMRDGRVELYVEKMVPAGGSILTAFRYRLPGATLTETQKVDIRPAPWEDGEVQRLTIESMTGADIGWITYRVDATEASGKPAWRVRSYMVIPSVNMLQYTDVVADQDSFAPVTGRTRNLESGDFQAEYASDRVKLAVSGAAREHSVRDIEVDGVCFDNEQVLYLIRRLPLAEGYSATFPIFTVQGGSRVECRIGVVGKERVEVPAGSYDCYKVDLDVLVAGSSILQHGLWFSADARRHLVKYDAAGRAVMKLAEVSERAEDEASEIRYDKLGISVRLPAGWYAYRDSSPEPHRRHIYLLPPALEAWVLLSASEPLRADLGMTIRKAAEGDVEALKKFFKDYTVRPDSWSDQEVAGLPAARCVADYQQNDHDMVEYRVYIQGKSGLFWFVFRMEKDEFDRWRKTFDAMVGSFREVPTESSRKE